MAELKSVLRLGPVAFRDPRIPHAHRKIRPIADQPVDAVCKKASHIQLLVDRPHLHGTSRSMDSAHEAPRHDANATGALGHLKRAVGHGAR
jgi:hypothetical protein